MIANDMRGSADLAFERQLLEAIDYGLSSLGQSGKESIYYYLEVQFGLSKQEICNNIEDFAKALERVFGLGANLLEFLIIRKLESNIGKSLLGKTVERADFARCIALAKEARIRDAVLLK